MQGYILGYSYEDDLFHSNVASDYTKGLLMLDKNADTNDLGF